MIKDTPKTVGRYTTQAIALAFVCYLIWNPQSHFIKVSITAYFLLELHLKLFIIYTLLNKDRLANDL